MPRLAELAAGVDQRIVLCTADDDVYFTEANLDLAIRWGTGPGEHEGEAIESDGMVTIERTGGGGDGAIAWPGCCAEDSNATVRVGDAGLDRKSVVSGKSVSVRVDLGGRRRIKKKKRQNTVRNRTNEKNSRSIEQNK